MRLSTILSLLFLFTGLILVSCNRDDDDDNGEPTEDLCSVSDSLPGDLPGWSMKRVGALYFFQPGRLPYRFLNNRDGYALGATLVRTDDGGKTWNDVQTFRRPLNSNLRLLDAVDDQTWFVLADTFAHMSPESVAVLLRTDDGGQTWSQSTQSDWVLGYFRFTDALRGFAWGFNPNGSGNPEFLRTSDGGATWAPVEGLEPSIAYSDFKIQWLDQNRGMTTNGFDVAYATDNGGQTWYDLPPANNQLLAYYRYAELGYFGLTGQATTQFTTDGGQTWAETDPASVLVFTIKAMHGFGVVLQTACANEKPGDLALAVSTDNGRSWQRSRLLSNFLIDNMQEVAPGLVVVYDQLEGAFYWIEKT